MYMGNPRGVARDFDALEARRMSALELMREGRNNSEIGRHLELANQTVSRWRKEYSAGGKKALVQAGRVGAQTVVGRQTKQDIDGQTSGGSRKARLRNTAVDV